MTISIDQELALPLSPDPAYTKDIPLPPTITNLRRYTPLAPWYLGENAKGHPVVVCGPEHARINADSAITLARLTVHDPTPPSKGGSRSGLLPFRKIGVVMAAAPYLLLACRVVLQDMRNHGHLRPETVVFLQEAVRRAGDAG